MAILLGVDTGGTYTDAVLVEDDRRVIASAKALTTRHDLAQGVGAAVRAVIAQSSVAPDEIAMASLSTTLATNALVEGQGGRIALVACGFRARDLEAHGLIDALKQDPHVVLSGGHDHAGAEAAPLDLAALRGFLEGPGQTVSAFAVAGQFATRNPAHELAVADLIAEVSGRPVSMSHQLSARLGGPKRAMTALLNARLIGMIDQLIRRTEETLRAQAIAAPLMVVRGDGALISTEQARAAPIETILSGPAASLVGARWLTGARDALVSDIGGTTTDIAVLREGMPAIDPEGARVGPYRTMVEAVAMRTTGLGGDSEVAVKVEGLAGGVTLGPRRVVPVSLLAAEAPEVVHAALESQQRSATAGEYDARFVRAVAGVSADGLGTRDAAVLARIGNEVRPLGDVIRTRMETGSVARLVARGLVQVAGITPSDASHVLGRASAWDAEAAGKALALVARKRTGSGDRLAASAEGLATMIIEQLSMQTAVALLEVAFDEDAADFGDRPSVLARHPLVHRGLAGHRGMLRMDIGLDWPVVGLGASAPTYYPAVGRMIGAEMVLPEHAGVANAIGAVVGQVIMRREGSVTAPSEGRFRVHFASGPQDFSDLPTALDSLERVLRDDARTAAQAAGAVDIAVTVARDIRQAQTEAREVFIEARLRVEAAGRPRVAQTTDLPV